MRIVLLIFYYVNNVNNYEKDFANRDKTEKNDNNEMVDEGSMY